MVKDLAGETQEQGAATTVNADAALKLTPDQRVKPPADGGTAAQLRPRFTIKPIKDVDTPETARLADEIDGKSVRVSPDGMDVKPRKDGQVPGAGGGSGKNRPPAFHRRVGPTDFGASLTAGVRAVRRNLVVVMIFTFATNILILAIPIYLFQISDRVLTSRSLDTLVMLTMVILGAVILYAIFDAIRRFILMRTAVEVAVQLGAPILSAAARASLHSNGREYQTLGDLQTLRGFLTSGTLMSFLDVPFAPIFIIAVFLVHPHLGIIVIITALLLFMMAVINQRMTSKHFLEANAFQSKANLHLDSMARNSQIINALAMIPEAVRIWGKDTAGSLMAQVRAQDRNIVTATVSRAVRLLTQVLMLGWGAYLAIDGQITGGMVIASSIIAGRALAPIEGSIEGWHHFQMSQQAYGRISTLLRNSPLNTEKLRQPHPQGRLDVERLLYVPQGTKSVILNGLSFSLNPGDSLAVIGNSGAGKTTLGQDAGRVTAADIRLGPAGPDGSAQLGSAAVWRKRRISAAGRAVVSGQYQGKHRPDAA